MAQDFDKFISDAAPQVPDAGPSRRMSRLVLHERMRQATNRRHTRQIQGSMLAASLVLLIVLGGQVTELGGDAFELEMSTLNIVGDINVPIAKSRIRDDAVTPLPGMDSDDVYELQQQVYLREGTIEYIDGYSFDGNPPWLTIIYKMDVNGETVITSYEPTDLNVESQVLSRDKIQFLVDHADEFVGLVESGQLEASPFGDVTSGGLTFRVRQYSHEFPGWGVVTYYRGEPIDRPTTIR
jgi:hypothetical protein